MLLAKVTSFAFTPTLHHFLMPMGKELCCNICNLEQNVTKIRKAITYKMTFEKTVSYGAESGAARNEVVQKLDVTSKYTCILSILEDALKLDGLFL